MRIIPSSTALPATLPHTCANCGAPCSGSVQVFVRLVDNPPEGRPRVNVISQGFAFCNPGCRASWWDTPTTEALVPDPELVASDHPIGATVFHVDPHNCNHAAELVDNNGQTLGFQKGDPVAHFRLDDGERLEAWWRGEVDVSETPLPLVESP